MVPLELAGADLNASVWLFRAGASLRAGPNDPHRAELLAHYRGESPSHYHVLGRYLLGMTDEASVLALGHDSMRSVEAAHYLGLKGDIERRLPDAIGWYRFALETNVRSVCETQLAYQRLGGATQRQEHCAFGGVAGWRGYAQVLSGNSEAWPLPRNPRKPGRLPRRQRTLQRTRHHVRGADLPEVYMAFKGRSASPRPEPPWTI